MKRFQGLAAAVLLGGLAWAGGKFTQDQLDARFYYDLGPASVNVSSYPKDRQIQYAVFARTCSQCHSLARPINAPLVSHKDWARYVTRMHLRTATRTGTWINPDEAKTVVDFLAYDSNIRKVDHKTQFQAETKGLKQLFADIQKERHEVLKQENQKKARETPMDAGVKPAAGSPWP